MHSADCHVLMLAQRQLSTSRGSDPDADRHSASDDAQNSLLGGRSPRWRTQDRDVDDDDLPSSDMVVPEPSFRDGIGTGGYSNMQNGH